MYKPTYVTVEFQGQLVEKVLSFTVVIKSGREYRPSDEYADLMFKGGRELSPSYLQKLEDHIRWLQNGNGIVPEYF